VLVQKWRLPETAAAIFRFTEWLKEISMSVPAETMETRENMFLRMIRRFNEAILKFIMTAKLRTIGATLLGALAGLSLTSNIIPSAMEFTDAMDSFSARWGLGGFAAYAMIIWGLGARSAQKSGDKKIGAIILGSVGLASGLIFTAVGIGTQLNLLLTGGGAAMLYGAIGGMIIGDAFRSPPVDLNDPDAGSIGEMGLFRYFKK